MEFEDIMSNSKSKKLKKEDRLSDLHDDLLLIILSFLPTKDAVATSMLSPRWSHLFKSLQRLEFVVDEDDDYSYSTDDPTNNIKAFMKFKGVVDGVLQKLSDSENITSFKLKFGKFKIDFRKLPGLFDELKGINIDSWLNYPLNHGGIKEVDISFYLKGFPRNKVPLGYFNCQTLEVLKLDGNFKIEVPLDLELPVLKELYLRWDTIEKESIDLYLSLVSDLPVLSFSCIDRLVSSCPLLQHLSLIGMTTCCDNSNCIRSKNLRSLEICFYNYDDEVPKTKLVLDVPNLETLSYRDHEVRHYFVGEMNALIEADIGIIEIDPYIYSEEYCSDVPTFLSSLTNVRSLRIFELGCLEVILKYDQPVVLPVFSKLKYLEIGSVERRRNVSYKTLLKLLHSAPILETLTFPEIFLYGPKFYKEEYFYWRGSLEAELWEDTQTIPTCLSVSLKRIMMKKYQRTEWELQFVTYFLKSSLLLEQLIIVCDTPVTMEDKINLQTTLQNLPLLSPNCSIIVH